LVWDDSGACALLNGLAWPGLAWPGAGIIELVNVVNPAIADGDSS
jgi:hypothetical protein